MSTQPSIEVSPDCSRDLSDLVVISNAPPTNEQTTYHDGCDQNATIQPLIRDVKAARDSPLELFVDARTARKFLSLHPSTVQRLARQGVLPAHPVNGRARKQWRFLLSELQDWLRARTSIPKSAA